MLATYAASRHRQIVPCCMISSVSHDNVSRLVTDRSMCFATALDKAFENIDCMSAILRCQAKNRFYESTQRLIQPRRVLCRVSLNQLWDPSIARRSSAEKPLHILQILSRLARRIASYRSIKSGRCRETQPNPSGVQVQNCQISHLQQYTPQPI